MRIVGRLLWPDGLFAPGWIDVDGGRVVARERGGRGTDLIVPGLCDLQVNGVAGVDVTQGDEALATIDSAMLDAGVTSYLATVMTTDDESAARAVRSAEERTVDEDSPLEGIHLEGPFLSPSLPGTHRREHLRIPADGIPPHFASPALRLVTLAPELAGGLDLARELVAGGGVVSLRP